MDIAFIDHYDSFSFNVMDWLSSFSERQEIHVHRIPFDDVPAMLSLFERCWPLVISPGPKSPKDANPTIELVQSLWGTVPILGVCLGHQILALVSGAEVKPLLFPIHGLSKKVLIERSEGIFSGFPEEVHLAAYNSLTVDPETLPDTSTILAKTPQGEVQAVQYLSFPPTIGLQFHPESFLSEHSKRLAQNWLNLLSQD